MALLMDIAQASDQHFAFNPPSLNATAVELDAELAALKAALQRSLVLCSGGQGSRAAREGLSRLLHAIYRHAGAARRFYEAHAARVDRAFLWATRALQVARAVEDRRAELAALAPGWRLVGPDDKDDVWWESEGGESDWVLPSRHGSAQ